MFKKYLKVFTYLILPLSIAYPIFHWRKMWKRYVHGNHPMYE